MLTVSPLSFLKSPMILMGLFTLVIVFGMPYLMDNSKRFWEYDTRCMS